MVDRLIRQRLGPRSLHRQKQKAYAARKWPIALFAALLLALVIPLVASRLIAAQGPSACEGERTKLVVATSNDKAAILESMAADFSKYGRDRSGKCVDVQILAKDSGATQQALIAGWQARDGERPDVYAPASRIWLELLEKKLVKEQKSSMVADPAAAPSMASSPQVVAMPRPMAMALGWPSQLIGWKDILKLSTSPAGWGAYGRPEWGRFTMGKSNPLLSQSGLNATLATYYAAMSVPGRLKTEALTLADIQRPETRKFVAGVEQSVSRYGDDSTSFLLDWRAADDRRQALTQLSALVTEEHLVQSYNEGNPTADPRRRGQLSPPKVPLVAVYPREGTTFVDHPYAVLKATWVTPEKRDAATAFLNYLLSDDIQEKWQDFNFRTADRRPGPKAKVDAGVQPFQPSIILKVPAPEVVEAALRSWRQLRKVANVLTVVDTSATMGESLPGSTASKLSAAQGAVNSALAMFTDKDEVGLWASARMSGSSTNYRVAVPQGPMSVSVQAVARRTAFLTALKEIPVKGESCLYNTVAAAHFAVSSRGSPERLNAVILLTDGRNELADGIKLPELLKLIEPPSATETSPAKVRTPIITIALGPNADQVSLAKIAAASGGVAYVAKDTAALPGVYLAAISNVQ